jgi:hypothetical protein
LEEWYKQNKENPYPSFKEKEILAKRTNLTVKQINSWINNERYKTKNNKSKSKITVKQKRILRNYFNLMNKFPKRQEIDDLIKLTELDITQVNSFFKRERLKLKIMNRNTNKN